MTSVVLDTAVVRDFSTFRFSRNKTSMRLPHYCEPEVIGRAATTVCRNFFEGDCDAEAVSRLRVAQAAGLLVYSMEFYGCGYEELCDLAGVTVANVVSRLSPDTRLPASRRGAQLRGEIYQADALVHVVKFAELWSNARSALDICGQDELEAHAVGFALWVDNALGVLPSLKHLQTAKHMQKALTELRSKLIDIQARIEPALEEANAVRPRRVGTKSARQESRFAPFVAPQAL